MKTTTPSIIRRFSLWPAPLAALGLLIACPPALLASELLLNGSFDNTSSWTVVPPQSETWTCIANGEAHLHPYPSGYIGTVITQPVTVANPGGRKIHFSAVMTKVAAPSGNTIEFKLEYLDSSNTVQHLTVLNPANDTIAGETSLSTDVVLPLNTKSVTGFSVNKTNFGTFTLQSVSLDLLSPPITITNPANGTIFTAGADVEVLATVDPGLTEPRKVDILDNGTVVGSAVPTSLFGEWSFPDGSHLSVMGTEGDALVDYNPPDGAPMYMMDGSFSNPTTFTGTFHHWDGVNPDPYTGSVQITFSYSTTGLLEVAIAGEEPLNIRNLSGGQSRNETFRFLWTNPPTGQHSLTAVVTHSATPIEILASDPVTITVSAPAAPEIAVQQPAGTNIADGGTKTFTNTTVGTNRSLVFTIKNTGTANLTGLAITKTGTNASDFTVTTNPATSVIPGASTTFTVRFAPTTAGAKTAKIHIANNDADENPYDITLTGWALGVPEIAVQQPAGSNIADGGSKTFANTTVGTNRSLVFTIKNLGSANLTGLTITKNGTNASDFTITTNPVAPVIAGGATTFTVKFAPTTNGSKTAAIHIASNDADENPYDITLTGWGIGGTPEIAVQQPAGTNIADGGAKTFANTTVGTNRSLVFTIKNIGSANLTGLTITKNGANPADFTVTANPVSPVIPGGATTFTVRFSPTTAGSKTAAIHIASNDADENPYDITLKGWGLAASPDIAGTSNTSMLDLPAEASYRDTCRRIITVDPITGLRYLTLVVTKAPGTAQHRRIVEVSPNLIDWYSGQDHTTTLRNTRSTLKVRDNTPITPGTKRYIRLKPGRN